MKKVAITVVLVGMVLSSGCSMINYECSKQDYTARVATQRAMAANDQAMVKAVAMGNTVAAGIDLADPNFWAVLKEHPVRTVLAAAADVAAAAAATWAITATFDSSHHDTTSTTVNGNDNTVNINQGQGNTISSGSTTTTEAP